METLAIIGLFVNLVISFLPITVGVLLIRHRQVIFYFKSAFTFIREDYEVGEALDHRNFFRDMWDVFRFACSALGVKAARDKNTVFGINRLVVFLGKLFVVYGIIVIIMSLLSAMITILALEIQMDQLRNIF